MKHYSQRYRSLRLAVMLAWDFRCALCRHVVESLEVHHIEGKNKPETPFNLVPLCKSCHHIVHSQAKIKEIGITGETYLRLQMIYEFLLR